MSWAEEDWTVGLSGRVLQKVKELQVHQERLSRENKQKQLQIDNIQAGLEKQTVKFEEARGELHSVQRELQAARDEAKAAVSSGERLSQELHTKQAQLCCLEGQLDAARTLGNKLTQEVKRLEVELEKLQNSSRSADTTLFSTPCWNTTSPWDSNGSKKKEERSEQRDEGTNRGFTSRQRLHFHDAAPSPFSQSHKSTPQRHPSDQSHGSSTPSSVFPWGRDDSRPAPRRPSPSPPQAAGADVTHRQQAQLEPGVCGKESDYRREADRLQARVSSLEEELSAKAAAIKSIQNEMAQSKKELAAKELGVQRVRDELSRAQTRMALEGERASGAEQKLKQLQEEMKCERKNAESCRLQQQQRIKELEKQHQRDLTDLQKERQCLEKQHQQEINKLNQELQQARTLHNALQAQIDKLSLQRQALDKELETHKEKLKWTEGQLKDSQKKETQTQAQLTEVQRKADAAALSLEQSRKKERTLEEEGRRLAEELRDSLRTVKELQEQKAAAAPPIQAVQFCPVGQSFSPQPSSSRHFEHTVHSRSSPATAAKQSNAEIVEKNQVRISSSFDREPGEGIDSEQITGSSHSECLPRAADTNSDGEVNRAKNVAKEGEFCGKGETSVSDRGDFTSPHCTADVLASSRSQCSDPAAEKLKLENAALRSELKDAREELQKRLDDLEAQRRAEAEARTRLKQLSRKHANQSVEKDEQDKEWRAQLEREKAEAEKLRKVVAALQAEGKKDSTAQEEEEERSRTLDDRESEMMELNIQLKKQLAEAKGQLALERDEREREANERRRRADADGDVAAELTAKLAALQAECEELRSSTRDASPLDAKVSATNSPLMYLSLCDDQLDSCSTPSGSGSVLPSPEQHLLFCQAANQRNTLVSQASAAVVQGDATLIHPDVSFSPEHAQEPSDAQPETKASSDYPAEVTRLLKEKAREVERAKQYQLKFEALQSQVTLQTKQLTSAFDKQSRHISDLLAELREKESALRSQEEELQRCKQDLDASKAHNAEGDQVTRQERTLKECNSDQSAGPQEIPARSSHTNNQESVRESEAPSSENQLSGSGVKGQVDATAELLSLRQENQLLQKKLFDLNASKTSASLIPVEDENQENQDQAKLNLSSSPAPPILDHRGEPADVTVGTTSCGEESAGEERMEDGCQIQINQLQQQVVALKNKLKALSAERQQQAEELAVWRLASQTAPIFDLQDETSILSQPQPVQEKHHQTTASPGGRTCSAQPPPAGVRRSCGSMTLVREDELLLSCSSNKLRGHIVSSRLQHSNTSGPPKKTTDLQGHTWDNVAKFDKDLEQENWDINGLSDDCEDQEEEEDTDMDFDPPPSEVAESPEGNPEVALDGSDQATASSEQPARDTRPVMSSVGSQTENTPCPANAATAAFQLVSAATQTEEVEEDRGSEEESAESPPLSPVQLPPAATEADVRMPLAASFPIPSDPARLAERIRRNRTQLSAAYDDTEYEPYGLPEVVMKGFADIPSGPSCPYIVRRGLLGTVVSVNHKDLDLDQETD